MKNISLNKFGFALGSIISLNIACADAGKGYTPPLWSDNSDTYVLAVDNKLYKKSCGTCHEAYPAGLLPPQSWELIIANLDEHFEKKVSMKQRDKNKVLNYLLDQSAGRSKYALSSHLLEGVNSNKQFVRITELPYFKSKHKSITESLSNCSKCHSNSLQGSFDKNDLKK